MSSLQMRDEGPVRVLSLSRPPGNTLDLATLADLRTSALAAAEDASVRALVLESGLPRYFSSGLDLDEQASLPEGRRREPFEALIAAYRALRALPKPTIAAMSGSALLGGWILAMACDWRLLAQGAKISLAEIRAALTPTTALVARLRELAGDPRTVKEMVLRGTPQNSAQALAASLVDAVLPEDEVRAAALILARRLAKSPPRAYAAVKLALSSGADDDTRWARSLEEFAESFESEEGREGLSALRAKRRPHWP